MYVLLEFLSSLSNFPYGPHDESSSYLEIGRVKQAVHSTRCMAIQ